ncbi:TerB N-terminal domain-containing protein [uncultured Bifidobacterium sp.]|uniref:TerB N-terminal domain-containing protein n=2 Tax=uncultured Bifidobacterium sp. TaxID=165187 RepID=UPI002583F20B|nr:TerB N-terminal domain-containing protein [uncultured Bifidobacterium sp.]
MALTGGTRDFVQEIARFALQRLHTQPRPGGRIAGSLVFDHPATGRRYAMLIGGHDLVVRCEPAHIASLLTLPGFGPTIKADHDTWMFIKLDGTVDLPTMVDYLTSSYAMASLPAEDVDVQATRFSAPETKMNPIATLEDPSQQSASTRVRMHDTVYTDTPIPIKPAASGASALDRAVAPGVFGRVEDAGSQPANTHRRPSIQPGGYEPYPDSADTGTVYGRNDSIASEATQPVHPNQPAGRAIPRPYRDQPIIMPEESDLAARPSRPVRPLRPARPTTARQSNSRQSILPARLRRMRAIRAHYTFRDVTLGRALDFYLQGASVADYRDDYDWHGIFRWQHPTYRDMDNHQLRGYFAWRTRFLDRTDQADHPDRSRIDGDAGPTPRERDWYDTCMAFSKVRAYEIICGIEPDADQGLSQLARIAHSYAWQDRRYAETIDMWIRDYLIDRNLTEYISEDTFPVIAYDEMIDTVTHPESASDEDYLNAAMRLSGYHLVTSAFVKRHADIMLYSLRRICAAIDEHLKTRASSLADTCFGPLPQESTSLFWDAIYLDTQRYQPQPDYGLMRLTRHEPQTVTIDPIRYYQWTPEDGWHLHAYNLNGSINRTLGDITREIDRQLRLHHHFGHPMKAPASGSLAASLTPVIARTIETIEHEREEAARPHITIDMQALAGIRHDADLTRDALIVDDQDTQVEDTAETISEPAASQPTAVQAPAVHKSSAQPAEQQEAQPANPPTPPSTPQAAPATTPTPTAHPTARPGEQSAAHPGTDDPERFLVRSLLNDEPYEDELRRRHESLSMLVDRINERMMDEIGDTVIEFDGDRPVIIEDYEDDLRQWLAR